MNDMRIFIFFVLLISCDEKSGVDPAVLARVNDNVLTVEMLETDLSPTQRSKNQVRTYIHDWVNETILFDEAKKTGINKDKTLLNKRDNYFTKLVVGFYLKTQSGHRGAVSTKTIRQYYKDNLESFVRDEDEAVLHHFITDNISEARSIRKKLIKKRSGDVMNELFTVYNVNSKTVKKGRLIKELDDLIFKGGATGVLGPKNINNNFHVVDVLKKHEKGTRIGLEEAHDEIYQRILKKSQVDKTNLLVDSLRGGASIFINSQYN